MIERFQLELKAPEGVRVQQSYAYRLYGWLMEQLPPELGDALHEQSEHPISHQLRCLPEQQTLVWTVNLLGEAACEQIGAVLRRTERIDLHGLALEVTAVQHRCVHSAVELVHEGRAHSENRAKITFVSPCTFKQNGRHVIFPQEALILQSLVMRWNSYCPELALTDPDAMQALAQGLRIVDYSLHTARYPLKETRIQGFMGSVTIEAHLALPLLELWNVLLCFAPYSGVGAKTTLGMGGAEVIFLQRNKNV